MTTADNAARDDWDSHWRHFAETAEDNPAEIMRSQLVMRFLFGIVGIVRVPTAGTAGRV